MIRVIEEEFFKNPWEEKANHPLQSWLWGEARKRMGIEILRLAEIKDEKIKNVFQLTIHPLPFFNKKIGYLPRSVFPSKEVLKFLYNFGKKNSLIFIKIEPSEEKSKIKNKKLVISSHPLFPSWTQVINLNRSESELLNSFHPKTRYNIRLAQKKGVIVREESNERGFKIFAQLYFDTCRRKKYFGHDYRYHQIIWETLKKKIAHILIAYYQNEPLAAYQIWIYKKVGYYPYGGSSEKFRNLMGSNLLMWEAIRFSKKMGAEKFDMWGSLSPDHSSSHSWAGFTRFKKGYNGQFLQMPGSFDLIIEPFFYKLYSFVFPFRELILKVKRLLNF